MELETRARLIADRRGQLVVGGVLHRDLEAYALKHLREAVEDALRAIADLKA